MTVAIRKVTARPGSFGHKLDAALRERGIGANGLAKRIAATQGGTQNNRRRMIVRWIQGATPVARNRHIVEDALELPRDSLKGDDEEEEDSVALDQLLVLRIREILQRELTRR